MAWSDDETHLLTTILDVLIPPNRDRGIPGAGELGVAAFVAEAAVNDARVQNAVSILLRKATGSGSVTPELVRTLEAAEPTAFFALLIETYKGYYSRPDMRQKVGVGAHPVHPRGYDVPRESDALLASLTAPVRERGRIYRDPAKTGGRQNGA